MEKTRKNKKKTISKKVNTKRKAAKKQADKPIKKQEWINMNLNICHLK